MDPLDLLELTQGASEAARKDILRSMYRKYYKVMIMQGHTPTFLTGVPHEIITTYVSPQAVSKNSWFITIQADHEKKIDPVKFFNQVKKLYAKKEFVGSKCRAVIEQRSEDSNNPHGWHIHIIAMDVIGARAGKLAQSVHQCFMKYCYASQSCVDVKPYVPDVHDKYILGDKHPDKMLKVMADKILREAFNLPDLISNYSL